MNAYEKELQALKPWDMVQFSKPIGRGYNKIITAGHGYLVVPKTDEHADIAKNICEYGFNGKLAYYLEEDSELSKFCKSIGE